MDANRISALTLILKQYCFRKSERLWLCKYSYEFNLCTNILKLLGYNYVNYHPLSGYKLFDEDGNVLDEIPQEWDVITDNKGARGLEPQQAIVFIPSENSMEQQSFLETISRCTYELIIIYPHYFDIKDPLLMPPVLHQVISEAICKDKIEECVVVGISKDDAYNVIQTSYVDKKRCLYINHESKEYKEIYSRAEHLKPADLCENEIHASP